MAIMLAMTGLLGACSPKTTSTATPSAAPQPPAAEAPKASGYVLRAQIYRTSLPVDNRVPVILSESGQVQSYPAPYDVVGQEPIKLTDGWLLDRRGISPNSAFTSYTYSEYAALKSAPSTGKLLNSIVPGKVVTIVRLPMTPSEAASDTTAVNALIRSGLKGCTTLYP